MILDGGLSNALVARGLVIDTDLEPQGWSVMGYRYWTVTHTFVPGGYSVAATDDGSGKRAMSEAEPAAAVERIPAWRMRREETASRARVRLRSCQRTSS